MQYLPKRYHRNSFLFSIRPLQLRNPCIPEFAEHARTIEERLNLEDVAWASIGDAFDSLMPGRDDDDEQAYRFALKQIVFGYALCHGWTFWGHFEQDKKPRLLFRSLIESCHFRFCSRFEVANYGALSFRLTRVDRMDQSTEVGEPEYEPRRLEIPELIGLLERQPESPEREAKFASLRLMECNGDLTNNVRSLSKEQRLEMFRRYRSFFGQRIMRDKNGDPINGTIEAFVSECTSERKGIGGRPNKDVIVVESFFTWLLNDKFHEGLGKKDVINFVVETAKDLSQSEILGKGVGYRKVEEFFDRNSYWSNGEWRSENWRPDFELWKTQILAG